MEVTYTKSEVDSVYAAKRAAIGEMQCRLDEVAAMEADYNTTKELVRRARSGQKRDLLGLETNADGSITIALGPERR